MHQSQRENDSKRKDQVREWRKNERREGGEKKGGIFSSILLLGVSVNRKDTYEKTNQPYFQHRPIKVLGSGQSCTTVTLSVDLKTNFSEGPTSSIISHQIWRHFLYFFCHRLGQSFSVKLTQRIIAQDRLLFLSSSVSLLPALSCLAPAIIFFPF